MCCHDAEIEEGGITCVVSRGGGCKRRTQPPVIVAPGTPCHTRVRSPRRSFDNFGVFTDAVSEQAPTRTQRQGSGVFSFASGAHGTRRKQLNK